MKAKLVGFVLIFFLMFFSTAAQAEVYVTLKGFEPDKLASIWLIKRFIDQQAGFFFLSKGDFPQEGIAFDVPEARLRRSHTRSTFETILQTYNLQDKRLHYLGRIIHDIEINTWEEKRMPMTEQVQSTLRDIIDKSESDKILVEQACSYLDGLYRELDKND